MGIRKRIVSNSRKVFPNVVKGYMTRLEDAERGHISRTLHCAASCSLRSLSRFSAS